ncbi:SDR family NAD(P)-dependent oxidoreductase [Celeribacter sp. ULVN23_4]
MDTNTVPSAHTSNEEPMRRLMVMTGATSGFGSQTVGLLADDPETRVIVGARGQNRKLPAGVEVIPLDLTSLTSVRSFANNVITQLGDAKIDVLILNAGIRGSDAEQRSEDGFGLTFAVNHLAHYLLARLLLPKIADGGRLVITASNMHNPPFKALAPKGMDIAEWANPSPKGPATGVRSYCISKLCNLMTAQSFARLDEVKARRINVIAFNPGLTGGTSAGNSSVLQRVAVRALMATVFPLLRMFKPEFSMNTPEHSGTLFAKVAKGEIVPPVGKVYVSLVKGIPTFPEPSDLARDPVGQDELWRASAQMVGLDQNVDTVLTIPAGGSSQ